MTKTSTQKTLRIAQEHYRAARLDEAQKKCRAVLLLDPNDLGALKLACTLARRRGRDSEAMGIAIRGARAHPHVAEFHVQLGELSQSAGIWEQAASAFQRAVDLQPNEPSFHSSLGRALFEGCQYERALEEYEKVIALQPDHVDAWSNKAGALRQLGRLEQAASALETALRLQPLLAPAHLNMALIRAEQERFDEAMDCTQRAIAIRPDYAEAHYNLGALHLLLGNMELGWTGYQWRPSKKTPTSQPTWKGEDLCGRTLGIFSEQGFGDTIQFVRYIPMLQQRGARVWLMCRPELERLLEPLVTIVRQGQPLPAHDFCCPLLDLPRIFGTTMQNIPAPIGYLKTQVSQEKSDKFRVGLAWAGSPTHRDDARRSMPFQCFNPLFAIPDIQWINLQVGAAAGQAQGSPLAEPPTPLRDFADTRAVIETLDLVISVDTAVAHLAGAIGTMVWVLLAKVPEWRWMLGRTDSPWYPTMRLFRQQHWGQWQQPIEEVAGQLIDLRRTEMEPSIARYPNT